MTMPPGPAFEITAIGMLALLAVTYWYFQEGVPQPMTLSNSNESYSTLYLSKMGTF